MKFALVVVLLVAVTSASVEHYHDYSVFRVRASNETQLQLIQQLEEQDVDFWRDADKVNMNADVMIAPEGKEKLLKYFADNGLQYSVLIADVEQLVENERQQQKKADEKMLDARWPEWNQGDQLIAGFWMKYQRYDQHMAFVNELAQKNPSFVQTVTFGQSYQGRSLKAVRIGVNSSTQKQVIWIQGGIHAREWISPAAVTYFAQQLVNKYNSGDQVTRDLLSYYDFYIVPVLNVDGYEYTHTNSRLWRKTRQPSRSWIGCIGADPNRNYGYRWGGQGASSQPCAETFRGERAFSEPETKAEADYLLNNFRGRLSAFIAVHSYGQYWLYPWGYGREFASNNAELNRVARVAVAAWNQVSPSTRFTIGTAATVLYAAAGGADDFALGSAGAKYAYTVECPDKGRFGFELPASEIVPVGRAMTNAFIALAQAVKGR